MKTVAVRMDDRTIQDMERARDPARYPTQSDFIREAIRRLAREERRRRYAADVERLMQNPEEIKLMEEMAEANFQDLAGRLAEMEQGEEE